MMHLGHVADELERRLASLFLRGKDGARPCHGRSKRYADDPHFKDLVLFHEFFHGDDGRGLGASHQTGWTALAAKPRRARRDHYEPTSDRVARGRRLGRLRDGRRRWHSHAALSRDSPRGAAASGSPDGAGRRCRGLRHDGGGSVRAVEPSLSRRRGPSRRRASTCISSSVRRGRTGSTRFRTARGSRTSSSSSPARRARRCGGRAPRGRARSRSRSGRCSRSATITACAANRRSISTPEIAGNHVTWRPDGIAIHAHANATYAHGAGLVSQLRLHGGARARPRSRGGSRDAGRVHVRSRERPAWLGFSTSPWPEPPVEVFEREAARTKADRAARSRRRCVHGRARRRHARSSRAIRGSAIGAATRSSRCAGCVSPAMVATSRATSCSRGRRWSPRACCRIASASTTRIPSTTPSTPRCGS